MSMHRARILLALTLIATLIVACGGSDEPKASPSPTGTRRITDLRMGGTLTTSLRNTITVYTFELPATTSETPASGEVFAAADVEACAGENPDERTGVGPQHFLLATDTKDGYRAMATGVRKPALQLTILSPHGCARGWVSFHYPKDQKARFVYLVSSELGRWRIP